MAAANAAEVAPREIGVVAVDRAFLAMSISVSLVVRGLAISAKAGEKVAAQATLLQTTYLNRIGSLSAHCWIYPQTLLPVSSSV